MTKTGLAEQIYIKLLGAYPDGSGYDSLNRAFCKNMAIKSLMCAEVFSEECDRRARELTKKQETELKPTPTQP